MLGGCRLGVNERGTVLNFLKEETRGFRKARKTGTGTPDGRIGRNKTRGGGR